MIFVTAVVSCLLAGSMMSQAFTIGNSRVVSFHSRQMSMEYIPSGMSKAQWEKVKEEEAKKNASKNLGKVGITKFKSRSFEAWQKDGQKHLFPVGKDVKLEERPYMQRTGGSWDASDIGKEKAKGQAAAGRMTEIDKKYEKLEKEGQLTSAPWAANLPWSNDAAAKYKRASPGGKTKPVAAKKEAPKAETPKKKGFFGF
mmetsp:Transcript_34487/g.35154  ORF Transcript_34487/g.35154 Transcript_34487/m.35154 type:complete len:199 (-) Transcript_34487:131-727(-)|eukprot:CAMPEP_0182427094 /NCGR_PEP_ID=MMETSP1167-20130531/14598_1 /TAXON_ID=2988 /ORGANISM="Mallomonas Sp, Strain CCMP3275" /LENGTH=198 /DNA_ID=CAMNT_0024609027 /DNA_START=61 /DNA_END=657 /DNA_ORIENTATION=-